MIWKSTLCEPSIAAQYPTMMLRHRMDDTNSGPSFDYYMTYWRAPLSDLEATKRFAAAHYNRVLRRLAE